MLVIGSPRNSRIVIFSHNAELIAVVWINNGMRPIRTGLPHLKQCGGGMNFYKGKIVARRDYLFSEDGVSRFEMCGNATGHQKSRSKYLPWSIHFQKFYGRNTY